ncbi:hypothetical protein [Mannheimia haemolytica]|uniref:hypothetical protein n=1 Tax=Mannheimia haemolytica TaxID=75985 RepID=UPI001CF44DD4|nr:hypothetical protein [Mannheimia haemolytica]MCB4228109.1 hypothetical protein [Mannheimia haemolytica]
MKKLLLSISVGISLTGCMVAPSQPLPPKPIPITLEEAKLKDFGSYPSNYEKMVKAHFSETLKDPDSVKYKEITKPKKVANTITRKEYYLVCATLNAKNSYGGYVGNKTYDFHFKNGKIEYVNESIFPERCYSKEEIVIINPR